MSFLVVKYDIASFADGVDYSDLSVASPVFIGNSYATFEAADEIAGEMCKSDGGEDIDIKLSNGRPYKGPRYVFRVAEDDKPPTEG